MARRRGRPWARGSQPGRPGLNAKAQGRQGESAGRWASNAARGGRVRGWRFNAESQRGRDAEGREAGGHGVVCAGPGEGAAWKATAQRKGAKTPGRKRREREEGAPSEVGGRSGVPPRFQTPRKGTAAANGARMGANRGAGRRGVTREDMREPRGLEGRGSPQRHRGHRERQGTNRPFFVEQIPRAKTPRRKELHGMDDDK